MVAEKVFKKMKYHKGNFKSIGKLIMPLVKRFGQSNIISHSKLESLWETIVGEDIARKAKPLRIKPVKGGQKNILYIGMTGPYMAEISLQTQDILEKINSYYLKEVVIQIKLQRLNNFNKKKVVALKSSDDNVFTKNEETSDLNHDVLLLEHALTKMKNNLENSRKKNEIMED